MFSNSEAALAEIEEAIRFGLNTRKRTANAARKAIEFTQNAMRFCDDDAALKLMSDHIIRHTAILNVVRAPIVQRTNMTVTELAVSIIANLAAAEAVAEDITQPRVRPRPPAAGPAGDDGGAVGEGVNTPETRSR